MEDSSGPRRGHYAALGVPWDAPARAVEEAFLRWQERRRQGEAGVEEYVRAECAYRVLSDPEQRARHDRQLGRACHPAWAPDRQEAARAELRRALALLARGRRGEAVAALERAVRLAPGDPECRSTLALALARSGRRLHEAVQHAERAAAGRPREASFLFAQAEIYRAAGLSGRARRASARAWWAILLGFFRSRGGL